MPPQRTRKPSGSFPTARTCRGSRLQTRTTTRPSNSSGSWIICARRPPDCRSSEDWSLRPGFACYSGDRMAVAVPILPGQQLAALTEAYRKAVARKRLHFLVGTAVFCAALIIAGIGAEVNLRTFFTYFGNFISYFDRILTLDSGARVWTNIGEWFWGWHKWLLMLGETILISYVGTMVGGLLAFALNFLAAENTAPSPSLRFIVRRLLEFARTVPGIVFALIFVIAFGLGPMAGVLAVAVP